MLVLITDVLKKYIYINNPVIVPVGRHVLIVIQWTGVAQINLKD